jgi:hypothetical protein
MWHLFFSSQVFKVLYMELIVLYSYMLGHDSEHGGQSDNQENLLYFNPNVPMQREEYGVRKCVPEQKEELW